MNGDARLATPGAVLLLVGVVLMWWGAGIFRDENGSLAGGVTRRIYTPTGGKAPRADEHDHAGAAGGALRR